MNQLVKHGENPPTFASKVRGLMLGLALGDAIGSMRSDVPKSGALHAGAASQLAAWTVEGLMRTMSRTGGYSPVDFHLSVIMHAYQRWAILRGAEAPEAAPDRSLSHGWHSDEYSGRGWLMDVPAMSELRGTSPSTWTAIVEDRPTNSSGCQAMLRGLPLAALIALQRPHQERTSIEQVVEYSAKVTRLTHAHRDADTAARVAARLAASCLWANGPFGDAVRPVVTDARLSLSEGVVSAFGAGSSEPCVPDVLERLAPNKTGLSALAGAVYVCVSFPDHDSVGDALEFAGWAPDGDSVAAAAGALLGALHGFEALPQPMVERLELGWAMDRLAGDLVTELREHQGDGGYGSYPSDPLDPWWMSRYPMA